MQYPPPAIPVELHSPVYSLLRHSLENSENFCRSANRKIRTDSEPTVRGFSVPPFSPERETFRILSFKLYNFGILNLLHFNKKAYSQNLPSCPSYLVILLPFFSRQRKTALMIACELSLTLFLISLDFTEGR